MRKIRGNEIGMIFQDPMTSLNPVLTRQANSPEALQLHKGMNREQAWARTVEMLESVGNTFSKGKGRQLSPSI